MHLVGDRFSLARNILARFTAGANEVFLLSRWGIWETAQDGQSSGDAEEQAAGDETGSSEDLKVVVSIKDGRVTIGVQRPSADPHIETFDDPDLSGLTQETLAVVERARAKWEDEPKHPAHVRPAPPARRRNRREQAPAQAAAAGAEAEQAQQQTLRLF